MSIRPQFKTYPLKQVRPQEEAKLQIFQAQEFLGGLVTDAKSEIIPENSFQACKNITFFQNQLYRRNGLSPYSLAKPDSNTILNLFAFQEPVTGVSLMRLTSNSIYRASGTGWIVFTGPGLSGDVTNRFNFTVADNRAFFTNGVDKIMEFLPGTDTYAVLGDADNYKYLTSAFERVIAANQTGPSINPINIAWSGIRNYDEWDPSVDISAGNTPLVNSPSDTSDDITGLFYIGSTLVITRQRSLWLGTNLPSATQPFNFFLSIPKIGADVPNAINLVEFERNGETVTGLVFYNYLSSTAYFWYPGTNPIEISQAVRRSIKSNISSPEDLISSYNADTKIWSLFIFSAISSTVKAYSYSFITKNWVYDEYVNISSISDIEFPSSSITIDELSGIISDLSGTIDSLGGLVENATRFFGFLNGDLCYQPLDQALVTTDNGVAFTSEIESKTFVIPNKDSVYGRFSIQFTPLTTGTVTIYYSKDSGSTFSVYKTFTVTSDMLGITQIILITKLKRARNFIWKFSTSDVFFTLGNYYLEAEPTGLSQTTK